MARMKDRKTKAKRTSLTIPGMKGVEGKRPLAPEGEHLVKVVNVEQREGQNAPYFAWEFEIASGKYAGAKVWNNTSLAPQALWNLRGTLEALGIDIPDDDTDIDLDDLVGKECIVVIQHEDYDGKKQARVQDILPAEGAGDDDGEDGDEDEAPKSKSKKPVPADDEDEAPKARRSRRAARDDDDEEDEAPTKKKSKKKSGVTKEEVMDMSQDELGDLIKEHELETDLEDYATLRKMKAAVVEALEEAGVLED